MKSSLLIIGIILLIIGVIGGIHYNSKNVACNTTASKIGQLFSPQATEECTTNQSLMYVSFLVAVAGLVLTIVGAMTRTEKRQRKV
jgi:TRAP-type C4-dicarboxylate transport system permease small subunit